MNNSEKEIEIYAYLGGHKHGYQKAKVEILAELKGLEEYYHVNPLYKEGMDYWFSKPDIQKIIERLENE